MTSCDICVEKFNKSTRLEIKCNYCDFSNCRNCFQKYLLETQDPYCMNCKKIFTRDFITENCTAIFVTTEYKKHRENVLLDREKSLMPATQNYVILEKEKNKIRKNIAEIEKQRSNLLLEVQNLNLVITQLYRNINNMTINEIDNQHGITERKKFIRKCPMEDCRGFLSSQWKCGICESKICNKCNEEKIEEHVCKPENVASMELLNRDTKPCPKCGTMIFRISGCSMMFCVECHCAWNWNTGLVESGVIHNPHYYEFIRNGGNAPRNHGDIPCGGLPEIYSLRREYDICKNFNILDDNQIRLLYNFHSCITHIQHYELREVLEITETTTRQLRVDFMLQKISEETFKKSLQQLEKDRSKKRDFNNIYQMFVDVSSDIFRQMSVCFNQNYKKTFTTEGKNILINFFNENITVLTNLKNYFNDNIKKMGYTYKCVYPGICDDHRFVNNYKTFLQRRKEELQRK
jgi:hypothetical protein